MRQCTSRTGTRAHIVAVATGGVEIDMPRVPRRCFYIIAIVTTMFSGHVFGGNGGNSGGGESEDGAVAASGMPPRRAGPPPLAQADTSTAPANAITAVWGDLTFDEAPPPLSRALWLISVSAALLPQLGAAARVAEEGYAKTASATSLAKNATAATGILPSMGSLWRIDGGGRAWVNVPNPPVFAMAFNISRTVNVSTFDAETNNTITSTLVPVPSATASFSPPPTPLSPPHRGWACGTRELSATEMASKESKRRVVSFERVAAPFTLTIPVVFHIIHDGDVGKIDTARIAAQMTVLNEAFKGRVGSASNLQSPAMGVAFTLLQTMYHPVDNVAVPRAWFSSCSPSSESAMKKALNVDPARRLNIYTCAPTDGILGWISSFPDEAAESDWSHGAVIAHGTLPGGDASPYNLGDTLVHEIGHYLGLFHPFQGGCHQVSDASGGDAVYDTSPQRSPSQGSCSTVRPNDARAHVVMHRTNV